MGRRGINLQYPNYFMYFSPQQRESTPEKARQERNWAQPAQRQPVYFFDTNGGMSFHILSLPDQTEGTSPYERD